jgi:hypothetical protein
LSAVFCHDGILVVEVKDPLGTKWHLMVSCLWDPRKMVVQPGCQGNVCTPHVWSDLLWLLWRLKINTQFLVCWVFIILMQKGNCYVCLHRSCWSCSHNGNTSNLGECSLILQRT